MAKYERIEARVSPDFKEVIKERLDELQVDMSTYLTSLVRDDIKKKEQKSTYESELYKMVALTYGIIWNSPAATEEARKELKNTVQEKGSLIGLDINYHKQPNA